MSAPNIKLPLMVKRNFFFSNAFTKMQTTIFIWCKCTGRLLCIRMFYPEEYCSRCIESRSFWKLSWSSSSSSFEKNRRNVLAYIDFLKASKAAMLPSDVLASPLERYKTNSWANNRQKKQTKDSKIFLRKMLQYVCLSSYSLSSLIKWLFPSVIC